MLKFSHVSSSFGFERKNFCSELRRLNSQTVIIDATSGGVQPLLDVLGKIRFT